MGWMWVRPGAAALGRRISEWDPSLRLIVQNRIYGSNFVDRFRYLGGWARRMGNVSGKTDGAQSGPRDCGAYANFANGDAGDPRAFAVSACHTGSCATGR